MISPPASAIAAAMLLAPLGIARAGPATRARERAAGQVDETRAAELPDVGVRAQIHRSTGNAVLRSFFAAPGFVDVAGATCGRALDSGAFQSGP